MCLQSCTQSLMAKQSIKDPNIEYSETVWICFQCLLLFYHSSPRTHLQYLLQYIIWGSKGQHYRIVLKEHAFPSNIHQTSQHIQHQNSIKQYQKRCKIHLRKLQKLSSSPSVFCPRLRLALGLCSEASLASETSGFRRPKRPWWLGPKRKKQTAFGDSW